MDESKREALFQQLNDEYGQALRRLCSGYERDESLRHDLEQEVLLNLWRSLPGFRGDASLRTWMYRVAHNTANRHVRGALRRPKASASDSRVDQHASTAPSPESSARASSTRARLKVCISQLRPLDRQVILLYLEDLPQSEIGAVTGLSKANVSTRVNRIKTELKAMMNP